MDAKIDPKVVMDLSIFKIGGWSELQPSDHKSLEKFTEENMPQLLVGFLSRGRFFVTQYLRERSGNSGQH